MRIASTTGVANPDVYTVTKGIAQLMITTDHDPLSVLAIDDPYISVWVEKANGTNLHILTNCRLKNFILMSTFGAASIHSNADAGETRYVALCELTFGGAIALGTNDTIKIKLTSLDPAKDYILDGIEEPEETEYLLKYDLKTVLGDDTSRELDVALYDLVALEGFDNFTDLRVTADNGRVCSYTPEELRAIQVDTDSMCQTTHLGALKQYHPQILIVPLVGVSSIEFIKPAGSPVLCTFRSETLNKKTA